MQPVSHYLVANEICFVLFNNGCPHSLFFLNLPRSESGLRDVVSLLPTVIFTFCVGVPVKCQQPISVIIEILG